MMERDEAGEAGEAPRENQPPAPMEIAGSVFHAVFHGKHAGVYTDEERARRAGQYRTYDNLEAAMKYYQLGFCSRDGVFDQPQYDCETAMSWFRGWDASKRMCTVYIRGEGDKIGINISTENQTFVQGGFSEDHATRCYLDAIGFVLDTLFGSGSEGGLLSPAIFNLTICLPTKKPLRKLKYPKSPMSLLASHLDREMHRLPVAVVVNPMLCQIEVMLEPGERKLPQDAAEQEQPGEAEQKDPH